jgi:hypothetical protein
MFRGDKKQIFSIRKLTIGAASVMIGATLLGFGGQNNFVKADTPQVTQSTESKSMADTIKINLPEKKIIIDGDPSKEHTSFFMFYPETSAKGLSFLRSINTDLYGKAQISKDDENLVFSIKFTDGSTTKVSYSDVFIESDAAKTKIVKPNFPIIVNDINNLSQSDINQISSNIKKLNPQIKNIKYLPDKVDTHKFLLTYADGSISPSNNVMNGVDEIDVKDWAVSFPTKTTWGEEIKKPSAKITANNPNSLSAAEKQQIISKVRDTNPGVSLVEVSDKGLTRLSFDSGSVGYLSPSDVLTNAAETPTTPDKPSQPDQPSNPGTDTPSEPTTPTTPSDSGSTSTNGNANNTSTDNNHKSDNTKTTNEEPVTTVLYAPVINGNRNWKIALRDSQGKLTGKYISTDTNWKVFGKKLINGELYYRLGS